MIRYKTAVFGHKFIMINRWEYLKKNCELIFISSAVIIRNNDKKAIGSYIYEKIPS